NTPSAESNPEPAASPVTNKRSEPEKAPSIKTVPIKEVEVSKPAAAATELDLGLPELHMDTQAGFWSRLSIIGKIGIAAGFLVVVTAAVYMISGGHATATPPAPVVSTLRIQTGAPITDASWMADWSPEAAKRGRHISILKSSLPLTDYRMLFDAQIENKA